jgi:hypothetical protein
MPDKTKGQKITSFIGWLSALLVSFSTILTFVGWLMYPHISNYVMGIVDANKGTSTRSDLAKEMGIEKEDVCEEIGEMYKDNSHRTEESRWINVGYFVNIEDDEVVKFHHWNGRNYDAWKDDQGWFYIKGGYKYYN